MEIEYLNDEILIRIKPKNKIEDFNSIVQYLKYLENRNDSEVPQEEIDKLSSEVNINWYKSNRDRLFHGFNY